MQETSAYVLGPEGPLAAQMAAYEAREGQLQMATAVEAALADEAVLLCEAGTGTGKTLAYLIPAVLSGKRVIISTATRALQDQLIEKDIPLTEQALGRKISASVLKGVSNYLCRRRFAAVDVDQLGADGRVKLNLLDRFASESDTGDLSELSGLAAGDRVREAVASSTDTRLGPKCPHHEQCFVTRAKRRADESQIVIVNHHLFFADLALRGPHPGRVLPNYDAVIFDEAHRVEDIAALFFGTRVSERILSQLAKDAQRWLPAANLLSESASARAEHCAKALFATLRESFRADTRTVLTCDDWVEKPYQRYLDLDAALENIEQAADSDKALGHSQDAGESEQIRNLARRARQARQDLATIVDGAAGRVTWLEQEGTAALCSTPVKLAPMLGERLFRQVPALVFTSATLSAGYKSSGAFEFLKERLGAAHSETDVRELIIPSPFDFATRARIYTPKHLPQPSAPGFIDAAVIELDALIEAADGGAFVLTTSLSSMRRLHDELSKRSPKRLHLVQGDGSKQALLAAFKRSETAVLVATLSFWEGVDVPGHALRLVVLEKLPFPVPSDPLFSARAQELEREGRNAFQELSIPMAQMTLQQGFGRLLRTQSDTGLVAILDNRLVTRGYGRQLLQALPPAPQLFQREQALEFLRGLSTSAPKP